MCEKKKQSCGRGPVENSARFISLFILSFALSSCPLAIALDIERIPKPPETETEKLSPQDLFLKKIQTEFDTVDIQDQDYSTKRYALFKKLVNETIRVKGWHPYEALTHVEATTHANAYFDKLREEMLKENPHVFSRNANITERTTPKAAPVAEESKIKIPQATEKPPAPNETAKQNMTADEYLDQIVSDFKAVDVADPAYETRRYALFKKLVNETIRLKASKPYAAVTYAGAITRANAYADRMEAEMLKENPDVFKQSANKMPAASADNSPDRMPPAAASKPTAVAMPPKASKEPPKPTRVVPPMLASWTSVMRNYIKFQDLPHAKDYAKKIIDGYPSTPEADEAKSVLQMSTLDPAHAAKELDTKAPQPPVAPVSDGKAKALSSMMRNYVNAHQLDKAKEFAKKIVDGFPGTPEADEAKTVLQIGK